MRFTVTIFGFVMAVIAVGCGSSREHEETKKSTIAADKLAPDPVCGAAADQPPTEAAWIAQLPAIILFKFREDAKEGLVAEPVCVRDRAHTPDWEDVVTPRGFFGQDLEVSYGRSRQQLEDHDRYAKLQVLQLTQQQRRWSGKMSEVLKDDSIWSGLLEYALPIEDAIELKTCTEAQMNNAVDIPVAKPEPAKTECH